MKPQDPSARQLLAYARLQWRWLALALVLVARLLPRRWLPRPRLAWAWQVVWQGLLGTAVLLGGLVWHGVDGKMSTYAALALAAAALQWALCGAWRR